MCITKTFVYDCAHKHLIRLACAKRNPLLCSDLKNRRERRFYDCCCCIEYQLGVDEERRARREGKHGDGGWLRDGGEEEKDGEGEGGGKDIRGWLESVDLDGHEGYGEDEGDGNGRRALQSVERDALGDKDEIMEDLEDGEVREVAGDADVMKVSVAMEEKDEKVQVEILEAEEGGVVLEGMEGGGFVDLEGDGSLKSLEMVW